MSQAFKQMDQRGTLRPSMTGHVEEVLRDTRLRIPVSAAKEFSMVLRSGESPKPPQAFSRYLTLQCNDVSVF